MKGSAGVNRRRSTPAGMKGAGVDPYATTRLAQRPMLPEQKAELAALSRDPLLNFDLQLTRTLTRGQADTLIGRLRKVAKTRQTAQRHKQRQQTKPTKRRQILVVK